MNKCLKCGKETKNNIYCSHLCQLKSIIHKSPWNKGLKNSQVAWHKGLTKETDERVRKLGESISKGQKKKVENGTFVAWNKGLTKDTDERVKVSGESISRTKKEQVSNGKYVNWNKNLTKDTNPSVKKISEHNLGKHSSEHKKQALKKHWVELKSNGWNNPIKGKKLEEIVGSKEIAEEMKKNIGEKNKKNYSGKSYEERFGSKEKADKVKYKQYLSRKPNFHTSIERKIQSFCKILGIAFVTHEYMRILHAYACDIYLPDNNIVIECDGDYWHNYPFGSEVDKLRTKELEDIGYKVIRLWERDIRKMDVEQFKKILESRGGITLSLTP